MYSASSTNALASLNLSSSSASKVSGFFFSLVGSVFVSQVGQTFHVIFTFNSNQVSLRYFCQQFEVL